MYIQTITKDYNECIIKNLHKARQKHLESMRCIKVGSRNRNTYNNSWLTKTLKEIWYRIIIYIGWLVINNFYH